MKDQGTENFASVDSLPFSVVIILTFVVRAIMS